jgi:hypothetical protein
MCGGCSLGDNQRFWTRTVDSDTGAQFGFPDHWSALRGLWSHVGTGIRVVQKHEPD